MTNWLLAYIVEMGLNAMIATAWALASAWNARSEPYFAWPMHWRWLVFNWMAGKAAVFWVLFIAVVLAAHPARRSSLPDGPVETVLLLFTVAHVWAFYRWLHLPTEPVEHRESR